MRRCFALLLIAAMLLTLAACGKEQEEARLADRLTAPSGGRSPAPEPEEPAGRQESGKKLGSPDLSEDRQAPEAAGAAAPKIPTGESVRQLDQYDHPADHPHDGPDFSVFDGIYRAELPGEDGGQTYLQIRGFSDFILLEYCRVRGEDVSDLWMEEFWPEEGWYTMDAGDTVSGKSQCFRVQEWGDAYEDEMPRRRAITLTWEGIVLHYDDSDGEYFTADADFGGIHSETESLWSSLRQEGSIHREFQDLYGSEAVIGTWGYWTGWDAACVTFGEDGSFFLFRKTPGQPVQVYTGVYGFGEYSGNLEILAEKAGAGAYPHRITWEWQYNEYDNLILWDIYGAVLEEECWFWPVQDTFFTVLDQNQALAYVRSELDYTGEYTDSYGQTYYYRYRLPQLPGGGRDCRQLNRQLREFCQPLIEGQLGAMDAGEFLSYSIIDWDCGVYDDMLFVHAYSIAFDWEDRISFYYDLREERALTMAQVLQRLEIPREEYLAALRTEVEDAFRRLTADLTREEWYDLGFEACLEESLSDRFTNLELPAYMDGSGALTVYLKLSYPAGSGIYWSACTPFRNDYGEDLYR